MHTTGRCVRLATNTSQLTALAASLALVGCGRSELRVRDGSMHIADADVQPDADTDAPSTPPCHWTARSPVALTAGTEDHALESAIADENAMLLGWQISDADPPHDQSWRLQRFGFDGSQQGGANAPLGAPAYNISYSGIIAAYGSARDGAIAWDEAQGCLFVPITIDGAVNGSRSRVGDGICGGLVAVSTGFTFLTQAAAMGGSIWALTILDTEGHVTQSNVPLSPPLGSSDTARRAVLADDSFVLFWTQRMASGVEVHTRPFTSSGAVTGPEHVIALLGTNALLARPITVGANIAIAWIDADASRSATASLATLDRSGNLTAPAVQIRSGLFRDAGIALAYSHGAIVVAWTEGEPTRAHTLFAQPFDTSLGAIAPPITADQFFVAGSVREVPSSEGVVIAYQAEPTPQPTQIYMTPIVCVP